jgi:PadR family transcriptional regulator PadR
MLKGVVDMLVLAVLAKGESYGYLVVKQLEKCGWHGVSEATIYGTLRRLHQEGWLTSRQELADGGRARRYYRVSPAGRAELARQLDDWRTLSALVEQTCGVTADDD